MLPEGWKQESFGNLSLLITKGATPTTYGFDFVEENVVPAKIKFFRGNNTSMNGKVNRNEFKYISSEAHSYLSRSQLAENDLLVTIVGTLGQTCLICKEDLPANINQNVALIRFDNTKIMPQFGFYTYSSGIVQKQIEEQATTQAQPSLNLKQIGELKILLPSLPEQQKIAKILSTWDEAIEKLERLISAKKKRKDGLACILLNGLKRFPGYSKHVSVSVASLSEGWERAEIKAIGDVVTGSTPPTKDLSNYGDEYFFVSPADMGDFKYVKDSGKKLSKKGFDLGRKIPPKSTLFTCIGSTIGKIGMNEVELVTNQQINSVVPNELNDADFVYYALDNIAKKVKKNAGAQAVPLINKSTFEMETLLRPVDKSEQKKIAKILSACDEEILMIVLFKGKIENQKQGLMQLLLTGKKRVRI